MEDSLALSLLMPLTPLSRLFRKYSAEKPLFFGLFIWAALVAYSRIYVGVHYPLDIIGGMLWGTFVALLVFNLYQLIREKVIR